MLRETPFHPRTAPLVRAQTWRRWAGCQVASAYDPQPDREYAAVRSSAALFDISPLCKYLVTGRDAVRLLDRMVTRDVTKCRVGQVLYTPWCDAAGKVIDDGTLSRLDERTFRLTSAEPNLRWLAMNSIGLDATIEDVTDHTAALALQGPLSRVILERVLSRVEFPAGGGSTVPGPASARAAGEGANAPGANLEAARGSTGLAALRYFRLVHARVGAIPVTVSRTGYTGDLGYEIWADAQSAVPLWDALIDGGAAHGITPAGIWALDIARIEAGLVMLDVDYHSSLRAVIEDQKSSPFELNLGWTVDPAKGPFNGRLALRAERSSGPAWTLVGLAVDWDSLEKLHAGRGLPPKLPTQAWRTSAPVYAGRRQVGYATSGCWSPLLKQYIALAHVRTAHSRPGTHVHMEITVEHRRMRALATIRKPPFFDPERKRS